ncbi:YdcF family protein [Phyllobacterium phragmitis]|uniref:YdcF family protein n=1 Tax=Phyllobacterium phragmitis TaxID=2670329 RepID=A0A2S9IUX0_9HYPH|nr:YdcF family protein [Phyllobacterium phragmitis]PRD44332.1 YdcF family protein [Phyllobacterium phragmitis]
MNGTIHDAARTLWNFHLVHDELRPADAIIGLGSYDLRVAKRAASLFQAGFSPLLVFTGKSGNWTEGLYEKSEAETFADAAIAEGVPRAAIRIEPEATNIGENIRFTHGLLGDSAMSVIIVTKPQTQRRVLATVARQWPEVEALISAPPTGFEEQPTAAYPFEKLVHEMVGDLKRILEYPAKGFQIPQDIPPEVMAAYDFLVEHGFDEHPG